MGKFGRVRSGASRMHFKTGRMAALAAAICLVVSTFFVMLIAFGVNGIDYPAFEGTDRLNPVYLDALWTWRSDVLPMQMAAEFVLAGGLLMVIHPVNCLRKIYSSTTAPSFLLSIMSNAFIVSVVLNGFEFLENLGTEATRQQLTSVVMASSATSENMASLEIAYNLGESLSVW